MRSRSHVARRAAPLSADFPDHPTLPRAGPVDGLAFVRDVAGPAPDLGALREVIDEARQGPLGDRAEVLIVTFVRPTFAPETLGGLPLRAGGPGVLASYSLGPLPAESVRPAGRCTMVDLWWAGARHRLSLQALTPVPLSSHWPLPTVRLHQPTTPPAMAAAVPADEDDAAVTRPSRARVQMSRAVGDPIESVETDLRRAEARIRLPSILAQAAGALFSLRLIGWGGGGGRPGRTNATATPREPGVLANLAGWLRWNTPLGAGLRRAFADRTRMVDKLIASGDIDAALKFAISLGRPGAQAGKTQFPGALPPPRATLDLTIGREAPSAPILGDDTFGHLHARYSTLARQLEAQGDARRAAYVYAKLLNDPQGAVGALEKGGLLLEAARMAVEAKLPPGLAVRLLYKAGERDAALALARRTAAFEELAQESRADPPFHAFVLSAWTDLLAATDQTLRALQVTDDLADADTTYDELRGRRTAWLSSALAQADADPPAELLARAILSAPWGDGRIAPQGWEAFPDAPAGAGPYAAAFGHVQARIEGAEATGDPLLDLLRPLTRLGDPARAEQSRFWDGPSQTILEGLAQALLTHAGPRLGSRELASLQDILGRADLPVLAADLGKLRSLRVKADTGDRTWRPPPVLMRQPRATVGGVLGTGDVLAWRDSGVLQLMDRRGAIIWQGAVEQPSAIIPVGSGPHAILVQARPDGLSQLTRFDARSQTFHPAGRVRLVAGHDITSDSQWLVQIEGEIGALDLVKLCAPKPEVEFLWSAALTARLQTVGFLHERGASAWITRDVSPHRAGVLELWLLEPGGKLENRVLLPPVATPARRWRWGPSRAAIFDAEGQRLSALYWDDHTDRRAVSEAQRRAEAGPAQDTFQPGDGARAFVEGVATEDGAMRAIFHGADGKAPKLAIAVDADTPLRVLARAPAASPSGPHAPGSQTTLLADDHGRLFIADFATRNVDVF